MGSDRRCARVELKARPLCAGVSVGRTVRALLGEVDEGGDAALLALCRMRTIEFVGWVERSETHHRSDRLHDGFRKCSTRPTGRLNSAFLAFSGISLAALGLFSHGKELLAVFSKQARHFFSPVLVR